MCGLRSALVLRNAEAAIQPSERCCLERRPIRSGWIRALTRWRMQSLSPRPQVAAATTPLTKAPRTLTDSCWPKTTHLSGHMTDLAYKSQANDSEITVLRPAVAVAGLTVAGTLFILRDLTAQRRSPAMSVFRTATTTTPK